MMPSAREMVLASELIRKTSRKRTTRTVEMRRRRGSSLLTVPFLILIGRMRAPIPMRRRMFRILLPMTLPRSISVVPLISEEMETASSGAPVPKATIVRPIRSLLTLKCEAVEDAPSINQSAPLIRMMKPTTRSKICSAISMCVFDYVYNYIVARFCNNNNKNGANEETLTLDLFLGKEAL